MIALSSGDHAKSNARVGGDRGGLRPAKSGAGGRRRRACRAGAGAAPASAGLLGRAAGRFGRGTRGRIANRGIRGEPGRSSRGAAGSRPGAPARPPQGAARSPSRAAAGGPVCDGAASALGIWRDRRARRLGNGARSAPATRPQPASVVPQPAPIAPSASAADESAPAGGPDPQFRKQEVAYSGPEAPGTIVIDTGRHFLFLVEADGRALRYGVGVGRPGFEWAGVKTVTRKAEWPEWIPPEEMLRRRPDLPKRLAGGPHNPLGARALYLGSTLYRIHGTNDPSSIGLNVSSGCIRMTNEDVIDLYNRAPVGTKVIVM